MGRKYKPKYYQTRVPDDFYKKEERKLGSLEPGWEMAFKGKRKYFVNNVNKTTTWVDPRTKNTRKTSIENVEKGELPYGWEELVDDELGVYYIDHLLQQNFWDPPWDPKIKKEVMELNRAMPIVENITKSQPQNETSKTDPRLAKALDRINDLEKERKKLEEDLEKLRVLALESATDTSTNTTDTSSISVTDSEPEEEKQEEEKKAEEPTAVNVATQMQQFTETIGKDQPETQQEQQENVVATQELAEVQKALEKEAEERSRLEQEIAQLKNIMEKLFAGELNPDQFKAAPQRPTPTPAAPVFKPKEPEPEPEPEPELEPEEPEPEPEVKPKEEFTEEQLEAARKEMFGELDALKKKVDKDKKEREKVQNAGGQVVERAGDLPNWIRKIEEVAANSKTLRVKIGKKQQENPDQLSFRERMLFYASTAIEGRNQAAQPRPTANKR